MSTRKQIILSAAILVVALGVVAFRLSSTDASGAATVQ